MPMGGPRAALGALPYFEGGVGVLRGKSLGISSRSAQVAKLRYSLVRSIPFVWSLCLMVGS